MNHTENRWALSREFSHGRRFLGRFCWDGATIAEPAIRTFTTRREAREAREAVGDATARVERVTVTVETNR